MRLPIETKPLGTSAGGVLQANPALLLALLLALALAAESAAATAYASGNTDTPLAYNENAANIENQTIIGEGANNNLHIVNTASSPVSPTGVNLGFASAAVVLALAAGLVALGASRLRRRDDLGEGGAL